MAEMQKISGNRAIKILEDAFSELNEIEPNQMTTFELNLFRRIAENHGKLPTQGKEDELQLRQISQTTFDFLKSQYKQAVHNFCDDPDEVCSTPEEAVEYYNTLCLVGFECGLAFWDVAKEEMTVTGGHLGHSAAQIALFRLQDLVDYLAKGGLKVKID